MSEQIAVFEGWVQLRDPKRVSERQRRPLISKIAELAQAGGVSEDDFDVKSLDAINEYADLLAIALIESWSFGADVTTDNLIDLPFQTVQDIQAIVSPMLEQLLPSFDVTDDPKAIIENSVDLNGS